MGNTSIIKIQEDLNKIKRQLCCIRTDIDNVEIYNSRVSFSTYSGNFDTEIALGADDISFPVNPHEDDTIVIHFTDVVGYYTYTGTEWALNWSTDIANVPVEFSQIQNIATNKLLGRSTAGSGVIEELTIGTGLSLSGGTLSNTATASPPAGSDGYIQYNNSGAFGASSNLFWDNANGRLGIGSSSPLTKLNVVETITTSPRGILSSQYSTSTDGARIGFLKARGTEASPTTVATGDVLGRMMFRGYDGSSVLEMASIEAGVSGTVASTRVPTYLSFSTATNAAPSVLTERMRILNNGNVGIGTSSPSAVLQVKGSGSTMATTSLLVQNSSGTSMFSVYDNGQLNFSGFIRTTDGFSLYQPVSIVGNGAAALSSHSYTIQTNTGSKGYGILTDGTVNQVGTTAFSGIAGNWVLTSVGSGENLLLDLRVSNINKFKVDIGGSVVSQGTITTKGYTVATLPTGTVGMNAYVTDALAPTYLTTIVGGGAVNCPVFFDGTNWVAH